MKAAILPILTVAAVLLTGATSCAPKAGWRCEAAASGVVLFIDPEAAPYAEVIEQLRAGRFEDLVAAAEATPGQGVQRRSNGVPNICHKDTTYPKVTEITYPSRSDRHIGPILELFYDEQDRLQVAEFGVMLLAP